MRRQLQLDDYEPPNLSFNVTFEGSGGKVNQHTSTEYHSKDMKIETLIRNSDKVEYGLQINPQIISKQYEKEDQHNYNENQNNQQQQQEGISQEKERKLQKFMRKVNPLMEKQLQENLPSYARFGNEAQKYFKRQSRLVHTLENLEVNPQEQKLEITSISWNASGVVVGAAYAHFEHISTCNHKSMICLWSIFKRNFKPTKPLVIYTPNCINCIQFHPKKPSVFACGSFTGEVLLYDFARKNEQLIAKTTVDDYFHKDLITNISWWAFRPPGKLQTNHNILSLGADGKILLWEVSNQAINQEATKPKNLMKYPLKGFLMLRKKENVIIPVSGLVMNQSRTNKNMFVVGSEGGSILRATLTPINHHINTQCKVLLDIQQTIKFNKQVYPFLLNLLPKNLRQIKSHVQKVCVKNKIDNVDNLNVIFGSKPQLRNLYPNPISFAYEALSYPISSISHNNYGLFIANGCDGYSRIYHQKERESIESIEQGYGWGWVNNSSKIAGFIDQQWVVIDWLTSSVVWKINVGQAIIWKQSNLGMAGVVADRTRVRVIELGDKILNESEGMRAEVTKRVEEMIEKQL